ncbi:MFS transporter [Nocardioides dongxiaopingii]|uniref:MFS transporter n=1 Tax=Nocardioides sp. S-1144 TaxID=2582905 RepID=UPI00110E7208|nr:MFS transporter [Nocardioides sp. S-1144]QCW51448.1 MFS transporter [Nocardioides sp. S-1144]
MNDVHRSWQRVAFAMFAVGWGANQFTPMLLAYREELGMSTQTRAFLFGVYAAGLVPALLVGGAASDRWGRRALVLPAVVLSPLASVLLMVEERLTLGLCVARLVAGLCSGVVFSAASAWVAELTERSGDQAPGTAARRAAIALSAGFGVGPLVTGLVAQWAPEPLVTPYLPHVVLGVVALVLVLRVPETLPDRGAAEPRALLRLPAVTRGRRFLTVVAPSAPWVFGSAAISIAFLPGGLGGDPPGQLAFAGVLAGITLGTGVLVQGWARRLDDRRPLLAGEVGLVAAALGCATGVGALVADERLLLLVAGPVLGAGYGMVLVSGLRETERLSAPDERGATVAVFYALTYLGFAAPYALGAFGGGAAALAGAGVVAVGCLVVVSLGRRAAPRS